MDTSLQHLSELFQEHANKEYALPMSKYMRDQFPFLGIKSSIRKKLVRDWIKTVKIDSEEELEKIVRGLWAKPEREFHYVAIDVLDKKRKFLLPKSIPLLEYLVTTHSWWDTVDYLSSHHVGYVLKEYPELRNAVLPRWFASENIWLQRTCLLFQLGYKKETDWELLQKYIMKLAGSKEFFIQKAIGWVLREYGKTEPVRVKEFLENTSLAPLSRREGGKYVFTKKK